ncbi:uncharacterized protein ASPGLDRAFT_977981 [Aspergillus glaucus CBS 516.65]|uniref:Uncharacterized protein n=1 Tax=Aspergillus glaucus CBS 516.65 TaxID=1160497 RepID=A0A1L9VUT5_ASPGL|nr:hypothetical protein ASPGLDRAFT_977981 [Aspergillus glaucus CBS 516.65]OJJ87656.1 hypothetical protein ASPGLDRAFT_977981 [Aspergillus glaucus CBS 516.65]
MKKKPRPGKRGDRTRTRWDRDTDRAKKKKKKKKKKRIVMTAGKMGINGGMVHHGRIDDCHSLAAFFWFTLHYFLWLAGEESREYTIRLAFLAFLFFVELRFSVSSWLYTQTSFYFLFIFYIF